MSVLLVVAILLANVSLMRYQRVSCLVDESRLVYPLELYAEQGREP